MHSFTAIMQATYTGMDNRGLMAGVKQGDVNAFTEIYRRMRDPIRNVLARSSSMLKDPAIEIEDILQKTFITAFKKAIQYNTKSVNPFNWIYTIVINYERNENRKKTVEPLDYIDNEYAYIESMSRKQEQ